MAATTMAIVVLIPGPLGRRLNDVRRRVDVEADRGLPSHLPLVRRFHAQPSLVPLERHCWQVGHDTAPFRVELGGLIVDEEGLLYFEVTSGREQIVAFREALLTGTDAPPRDGAPYEPRAVVCRLPNRDDFTVAECEEAAIKSGRSFYLERIELMARYPDGAWYERDFYTLDRAVTRA